MVPCTRCVTWKISIPGSDSSHSETERTDCEETGLEAEAVRKADGAKKRCARPLEDETFRAEAPVALKERIRRAILGFVRPSRLFRSPSSFAPSLSMPAQKANMRPRKFRIHI
jgi:hypothetical protein